MRQRACRAHLRAFQCAPLCTGRSTAVQLAAIVRSFARALFYLASGCRLQRRQTNLIPISGYPKDPERFSLAVTPAAGCGASGLATTATVTAAATPTINTGAKLAAAAADDDDAWRKKNRSAARLWMQRECALRIFGLTSGQ